VNDIMSLDEDELKNTLRVFLAALEQGYSLSSSPIELLLEAYIEYSLLLSKAFAEGRKEQSTNPEIVFDYSGFDALGNPPSHKVFKTREWWYSQDIADFFGQCASLGVLVKRKQDFRRSFMDLFDKFFPHDCTSKELSEVKTGPKESSATKLEIGATVAYHRRRKKALAQTKIHKK